MKGSVLDFENSHIPRTVHVYDRHFFFVAVAAFYCLLFSLFWCFHCERSACHQFLLSLLNLCFNLIVSSLFEHLKTNFLLFMDGLWEEYGFSKSSSVLRIGIKWNSSPPPFICVCMKWMLHSGLRRVLGSRAKVSDEDLQWWESVDVELLPRLEQLGGPAGE